MELDVRLALDELQSAEDEVKVAQEGLALSENELAQARRRYEAGVANSVEVTDAQTRLERARDNQTRRALQLQHGQNRPGASHRKGSRIAVGRASGRSSAEGANQPYDGTHMKKRIIPILILLAAAGAALYAFRGAHRAPDNRLMVSGNIELTEVNIAFKTAGRLIERTVDEGDCREARPDHRAPGPRSTARPARARSRRPAILRIAARPSRELARMAEGQHWRPISSSAAPTSRPNDARLAELNNGARPQEKLQAKAAVDSAQSEYERAKRDWDRGQTLYKNDDISTAQYDQYRNRFETAEAALKNAQEAQAPGAGRAAREANRSGPGRRWSTPAAR